MTEEKKPETSKDDGNNSEEAGDIHGEEEPQEGRRPQNCCGIYCCCKYTGLLLVLVLLVLYMWPIPNPQIQKSIQNANLGLLKEQIREAMKENKYTAIDEIDCGSGRSMLHLAAQYDHPKLIEYLIREGSDVNKQKSQDDRTPLHLAAAYGGTKGVHKLLQNGANINAMAKWDWTAIQLAVWWNNVPVIEAFLQYKDIDLDSHLEEGLNVLQIAFSYCDPDIIFQLIDRGAEILPSEKEYQTYVDYVARRKQWKRAQEEAANDEKELHVEWDHIQAQASQAEL